jgi:hypothetical protein
MFMQPLGRASFFPSLAELKKADAKVDYEGLNSRLFKYKGDLIIALKMRFSLLPQNVFILCSTQECAP